MASLKIKTPEGNWINIPSVAAGNMPNISMKVETLPAGSNATVTKSGSTENPVFTIGIPQGEKGEFDGVRSVNGIKPNSAGNVDIVIPSSIPVGAVIALASNHERSEYLLCNGAEVSRSTYASLFAAIGTTYGSGNGSTTFNVPNLTEKFIQGSSTAGNVRNPGLPNITGSFGGIRDVGTYPEGAFFDDGRKSNGSPSGRESRIINFSASRSSAIYGASNTVQPPALTMRYYIKY